MKRKTYWAASWLACLLLAGCASIVGTWHRDTLALSQDPFPIDVVTFDETGSFTATGQDQNSERTWTGLYRWDNRVLTFMPNFHQPKSFSARLSSGDKLIMSDDDTAGAKDVFFRRIREP